MPDETPMPIASVRVALRTTGVVGPLHVQVSIAGPEHGAPVILLHGFPDHAGTWQRQIEALATAGYRVIAPDQRGYASSDKPRSTASYRLEHLARDVVALQDALCDGSPTHVVGHDWGGGVAWAVAALHPARVRSLTVLNCPRPEVLRACLTSNPRQLAKSWYILFFQLPWLPAWWLSRGGAMAKMHAWGAGDAFTADEIAAVEATATRDAMAAAVRWYKAALTDRLPTGPIDAPTLLIWGTNDRALGDELAAPSLTRVADSRIAWVPGGGHWPHITHTATVNAALLDHLGAHGGADPHVYKLVDRATWQTAPDPWPGAPVDLADGFVHFSAAHQVDGTLRKHFAGQPDLLLLAIDPGRLPPGTLRWEVSRGGARFPHLYAPLPHDAVVTTTPLAVDARGEPVLPASLRT
ncbi:MAG: alpha/beta fold hydrolase [Alphaproteobacteria bacterium]|nr:alpha/beta fold hydrolase [Alphaproteobacteria bacterium]